MVSCIRVKRCMQCLKLCPCIPPGRLVLRLYLRQLTNEIHHVRGASVSNQGELHVYRIMTGYHGYSDLSFCVAPQT